MIILDFHIQSAAPDKYSLQVFARGQSQPLAEGGFDYALSYMTPYELSALDFDPKDPQVRFERLKAFGGKLYQKLFAENIKQVWEEQKKRGDFVNLCLRIAPEASGLEALPWETLFDGAEFIAAGVNTGLSRLPLDIPPQKNLAAIPLPLKMLALIASPLDLPDQSRLQIEREQEILLQAINAPAGQGRLSVDFEDEAKLEILEHSLEADYHIFHYTGHGIDPAKGGGLLLEDAEGKSRPTAIDEVLGALQKGQNSLRLAVLSGCQTARTLYTAGFNDLARGLLRRGMPAVVAMQFSISDDAGLLLAEKLYSELAAGRSMEKAISAARRALLLSDKIVICADALAPVLLAANGECLMTTRAETAPVFELPKLDFSFHLPLPQLSHGFYGRRREYRQIRDGLIARHHRAVIIHGLGGIGKTALVSHAASRLRGHFKGVYAFDCSGGTLAPERILLDLHRFLEAQGVNVLQRLLHQSFPPETLAGYLGQVLSQWPLLIIFDNFETQLNPVEGEHRIIDENLRVFLNTLVKTTATGTRFLFTTRYLFDLDAKRLNNIDLLSLGDLSNPEAVSLMQKLPKLATVSFPDKRRIMELFGGHPYALVALDRYCHHEPLDRALQDAGSLLTELREFLAIELNYARLSAQGRELLNRLAAFREPVPFEAAEWVVGERLPLAPEVLQRLNRDKIPAAWQTLDDETLLAKLAGVLPEQRRADNLTPSISELIEWGLLIPTGESQQIAVHNLVRDFCRDQLGERTWRTCLRDAAAFYTNKTKLIEQDEKTLALVNSEMEAFELLMEAEDFGVAASVLTGTTPLLGRWGFGRYLESQYLRILPSVASEEVAWITHNIGVLLHGRGDYAAALMRYEQSLKIKEELGNRAGVATSLHQIGIIHQERGEYETALALYGKSLKINEYLGNRAGVAATLGQIGIIHQERGEYEAALAFYEKSLKINEELSNRAGVASTLSQIGIIHQERGEYKEALALYQQTFKINEELGDRPALAISLNQIGIIHQARGEYEAALTRYQQSLKINEELGNRAGVALSLHEIGMVNQLRGEDEAALERYQQSLKIKEELGNRAGVAASLHQIGIIHQERGEYEVALARYHQSLKILDELGNRAGVASSLNQIGIIHQVRGEYEAALERSQQSLTVLEELGNRAGVATSLHQIGITHYLRGEYMAALARYQQSLKINEELGNRAGVALSNGALGQLFAQTGRYDEAMERFLVALSIFIELQSPSARVATKDLKELRATWGEQNFDSAWQRETGVELPDWFK